MRRAPAPSHFRVPHALPQTRGQESHLTLEGRHGTCPRGTPTLTARPLPAALPPAQGPFPLLPSASTSPAGTAGTVGSAAPLSTPPPPAGLPECPVVRFVSSVGMMPGGKGDSADIKRGPSSVARGPHEPVGKGPVGAGLLASPDLPDDISGHLPAGLQVPVRAQEL